MSNILYKIGSILKSGLNLFDKKNISKRRALQIQRDAFNLRNKCDLAAEGRAPYIDIIQFLDSELDEVFFSAVTSLINIAQNEKSVRTDIKNILKNKIADNSLSAEHRQYIANKIEKIQL